MMKTKVKIFIIICALFTLAKVSAQTYYYNDDETLVKTQTFVENGYTYESLSDFDSKITYLYNRLNSKTIAGQTCNDGSPLTEGIRFGNEKLIAKDAWTKEKCRSIVNDAFSGVEKQWLKDTGLMVCMTIDTNTGKVVEVEFAFRSAKGFAAIPISVFRKIELDLKNNVWFTLTDAGKNLNFIRKSWIQEVE